MGFLVNEFNAKLPRNQPFVSYLISTILRRPMAEVAAQNTDRPQYHDTYNNKYQLTDIDRVNHSRHTVSCSAVLHLTLDVFLVQVIKVSVIESLLRSNSVLRIVFQEKFK